MAMMGMTTGARASADVRLWGAVIVSPHRFRTGGLPLFETRARKGSMGKFVPIDPCSSLVFDFARRINSAIRERGLRRSALRNYFAPVVADCSVDPATLPCP